jgi:hypothetical protein
VTRWWAPLLVAGLVVACGTGGQGAEGWNRVSAGPAGRFETVLATGSGFLAGGVGRGGPPLRASADGRTWSPVADPQLDGQIVSALAAFQGRLYAAGATTRVPGTLAPAVWTSTDARRWTPQALPGYDDPLPGPHIQDISAMAAGVHGLVAVGGSDGPKRLGPLMWHSPDGQTWRRLDLLPVIPSGLVQDLSHVVATDWGYAAYNEGDPSLLLVSPDGDTWTAVPGFDRQLTGSFVDISTIAADRGSLLAFGMDARSASPVVWRTADGRSWTRAAASSVGERLAASGRPAAVHAFARLGAMLIAGGDDAAPNGDLEAAVWTGRDGGPWTRAPGMFSGGAQQRIAAVATNRDIAVAVGSDGETGAIWRWPA